MKLFVDKQWVATSFDGNSRVNMCGRSVCPPEIKIMGTLYWLGEGCSFRTIHNVSGRVLSRVAFASFAKKFCRLIASELGPLHIRVPASTDDLRTLSAAYAKVGFPGACGSTDGVQIAWEGCPFAMRQTFSGKEKHPTVGFNVTVDPSLRILHVSGMFAGRFNDKTKIHYDVYVQKLRNDEYKGFSYSLRDQRGVSHQENAPYLICDNGYHRWLQLMCPSKTTSNAALALWSRQLESVRKDVERCFGVMKKRFRVLKLPILLRDVTEINDVFKTCAVLHNVLLTHDSQGNSFADQGYFRRGVQQGLPITQRRRILVNRTIRFLEAEHDFSYVGREAIVDVEVDRDFDIQRNNLAIHLFYMFQADALQL